MDTGIIIVLLMLIIALLGFLIYIMQQKQPAQIKIIREHPITKEKVYIVRPQAPESSMWSWPLSWQWPWWQSTRPGVWGNYGPYHGRYH